MKKDNLTDDQRQQAIKKLQNQQRKEPQQIEKYSTRIGEVIGLGLVMIEKDGEYLSPESVKDSELLSTIDQVKNYTREYQGIIGREGEDKTFAKKADEIYQWAKNYFRSDTTNEYERKCENLFSYETVVESDIGTIISTIPIYSRCSEMENYCKDSEFIGKVGKSTGTLFLKLMEYQESKKNPELIEPASLMKCRDRDGNFYMFWSKDKEITEHQLEIDDCFSLEAKVNKHVESSYDRDLSGNKIRQTQLNYVKVVENYGKPK